MHVQLLYGRFVLIYQQDQDPQGIYNETYI